MSLLPFLRPVSGAAAHNACLLFAALALTACANTTSVSSNWHNKSLRNPQFSRIIVVGVTEAFDERLSFEDAVVADISGPYTTAWPSGRLMGPGKEINEENMRAVVAEKQADAVIVTKVTSVDVQTAEAGGRSDVIELQQETGVGMVPQRRPGTIFQYDYEENIEPVYITREYTTVLTTDVYSTADGTNVYTVVSTAKKQETLADVIVTLSDAIADRLRSDKVIR